VFSKLRLTHHKEIRETERWKENISKRDKGREREWAKKSERDEQRERKRQI
jgi:hypothetical protein